MKSKLLLLVALLAFGGSAVHAQSSGIFLELPGIQGESNDDDHADEIDLASISFSVNQSGIRSAGGRGSPARSNFSVITLTKSVDKSSPQLFLKCALGEIIPTATIAFETSDSSQDYLTIELTNVVISSYQTNSGSSAEVTETFSLSYGTIKVSYRPQLPTGQLGTPIVVSFDVNRNRTTPAPE